MINKSALFRVFSGMLAVSFLIAFAAPFAHADKTDEKKYVALTFDDGPHPGRTREILALLKTYNIKATFFVIGFNVEQWSDIVAEEIEEGHEVGNHTFSHKHLSTTKTEDLKNDLMRTDTMLVEKFGYKPTLFRPPEGFINDSVKSVAAEMGYTMVLWDVDTKDWANTGANKMISTVKNKVKSGDIILFHDYIVGKSHTYEALETLIPWLIDEGYTFVTVSELYKAKQ